MKAPIYILVLLLSHISISAGTFQNTGNISLQIEGIEYKGGTVMIALFGENDKFLKEPSYSKEIPIKNEESISVIFKSIPFGKYAISIYHDLNDNEKLDANFIKIPKEPIGFSNNYFPKFGPPSFKGASFILESENQEMVITLKTY